MGRINIKNKSGKVLASTEINEGSKRKFTLMKEDYVSIKFSLSSPIVFGLGSYVETTYGRFEICDEQRPSYNTNTGGYDYELRFDAEYWKWKNKIFKFTPEAGGQEASWNLTATLDVQLGVFLRNLKALGYSYNGVDYIFSIDSSVENKAVLMSYDNTNLLDALFLMASKEKWNCDCWITDNVIHFGRCEFGDAVKVEQAVNAEITSSESKGAYATRVYAFGGTKNISQNYRPTDENVVVNGIVQKRLMLPAGTPYIDAYRYHNGEKVYLGQPDYDKGTPMPQEEAIEDVVVLEEVFPKTVGTMYGITTKEYTDKIENQDGTTTEKKWNAYRYKDASLQFSKDYILPGQELSIYFQSGKLNGMVFAVKFNPDGEPEKLKNGSWNTEAQLWEIVRNETYGRPLPDEVLKPADGDKFVLTGFNTKLVGNAMVPEAEQKLKVETEKYVKRTMMDDGTYTATIYPSWIYEDEINRTFGIGQKINLIAPELFKEGRVSRVIGYEFCLDIPYDHPAYTIGESAAYSRIGELEDKVESLTYKGQTYEGNSGSGVYVIRTNDSTPASDSNVFSSLRTLATFLRKDQPDATKHLISLLAGALFGNYSEGVSGAKIDERGKSELADLIVRGRIESPHYNPGMLGSGYMLKYDKDNGRSYMEVDELAVRMKAVFAALEIRKLTYAGGNWVFSAAGAKCTRVEEFSGYYRCFFTAEYGSQRVENEFRVDDQVRYQEGNFALGATPNASNHFGWRKVIALGEDYIDLSKTDCMANSDAPAAGDDLVQLGNRTDAQRQNAIAISAYGEGSPSITQHKGIKSYSLAGTEKTRISPQKNVFTGELHFESGVNVEEQVGSQGEQILEALEQAAENSRFANAIKKDVDAIKNQVDGIIETWFLDPVPTLSNKPAVDWTTDAEKKKHVGDMYYDANGKAYRFSDRGGKYQWETITDSDIIKALEAAKKAQDTADGKRRVFVEIPSSSSVYDIGDLWVNATHGSYKNELLRCKTAKTSGIPFDISHWEKACNYTDDTTANQAAAQADQAKKDAAIAQNNANIAISNANKANGMLADIASDSKLTASEKQQTKKEWDIIVSEKPKNDAAADRYGISKAAYGAAYNSLSAYITPLLATLTATSPVVGTDFRRNFKAYYDARTDLLNAISLKAKELADRAQQEAGQAASKAEQAKADAAAAQSKANSAYSVADAAKNRLDSWAADGSISPVEKHAIKDEVTRIDADKSEILADYNRYAISSPSHFISQHAAYRGMLVSLSAATPETIAIPSGFAAQQKSYYDARTACLNAIAIAAKKYADDTVDVLRTETKASIDALNGKISLKVDSSTFNSLKQQVQTQGSELQLAKDVIKTKVSQSTFDEQREKQNILAACNDANMVTDDPTFARGTNDIIVYNNASSNAVTITRKAGCGVNSSNYYLDIAAAATGAIEPGYGGFTFRYNTKARLRLVCRFSAWLDKGRRFEFATNATGDNSRHFWLTDNQGKGTWADYAYYVECGTGGSFPSTFFFYVTGGNRPVSTWLSYATIHMLSADADFKHRISTAETKITQTANSISLKADKSYVDGINNRLSSAEIALNPDQIWLKVSERVNQVAIDKSKRKTVLIDAMSLDQNIYYPVIIPMTTVVPQYRIKVYRTLNSSLGVPGWSTHGGGFSLMVSWVTNASGWGTIDIKRIVEEAVHWHTNVIPVGSIGQLNNGSIEYIYVRGGSKYYFEIEGATDVGVYLKTGSYTNNGQTVAPQTKVTFPQREQPTREEIKAGIGVTAGGVTVFGKTISLNGVVTFASLASDAQGKINTAQSTATAAQNTANTARSEKITLARLEGTVIDGGHIKTSLIDVDWIFAREITSTKFNLTAGTIGGFVVSGNSLSSTNGAYGESGSRFFLHSRGSGDNGAFLGFRSDNKWVGLGLNCFSSVVGETCLMRLENTKSEASSAHSKTGLYIDVTGAGVYDDSGMGNNAIWIRRGHISGLRRRTKRTNSNPTNLKNEDNIVICVNTYADMVVNLPSNPEDGQEVWMISANEKSVQVRTIDGSNITNPGRRFTDMRWNIYIYDAANKTWWYSFMNR